MSSKKLSPVVGIAFVCIVLLCLPGVAGAATGTAQKLRINSIAVGSKKGPLTVRVHAGVHAAVTIWIDGRRARQPFEFAGRHVQSVSLRSTDGLHQGVDRIRIRAAYGSKAYEARRTVRIPAWALLADAGENVGSAPHAKLRVGTATVGGKSNLRYSWSIARRPGSRAKATLSDGNRAQPIFHARTPGTYVLQLKVAQDDGGSPSYDQVVVPVAPTDPPIGAPIDTLTEKDNAISIAGQSYDGGNCQCTSYVLLERSTRALVEHGRVENNAAGMKKLNELAETYGAGSNFMHYLLVLSGPKGVPHDQLAEFSSLLKKIGAGLPMPETFATLENPKAPGYSVIGIPGAPAGAATVRFPVLAEGSDSQDPAAMIGYLQRNQALEGDGTPLYEYVSPEHPTFDTRAESSATSNTMVVDGVKYSASLPASATAGFQLVALDSLTLHPLANRALVTNAKEGHGDQVLQYTAAEELAKMIKRPGSPVVLVQTIGKPKAAGPEWEQVVRQLDRLGANPQLVNALDGTTEYALVSRAGGEAPPAESSTAYEGAYGNPGYAPARLTGMLARGRSSNFLPNVSGTPTAVSPTAVNLSMAEIAYQKETPWPELAPGATRKEAEAAQTYICEALNFCQPTNSCSQVRECFWQKYNADWHAKGTALDLTTYKTNPAFSEATFNAVKAELGQEIVRVASVQTYFERLEAPLDRSKVGSYVDLQQIGETIRNAVQAPPNSDSKSWILGLISKVVLIGTAAPPPISNASAGISAAFGVASYLSNKQGQPILGSEVKARTDALAGEMVNRLDLARKAMNEIALLMVSDYGKLEAAYKHIDSDWTLPTGVDPSDNLRLASKQWFWEALIPTAYPYLIRGVAPSAKAINCHIVAPERDAWPNQPEQFQSRAIVGYQDNGTPIRGVFFFTRGIGGGASPDANKLDDTMFRPLNAPKPGLGLEKLSFFTSRVFGQTLHAVTAPKGPYGCGLMWLPNLW